MSSSVGGQARPESSRSIAAPSRELFGDEARWPGTDAPDDPPAVPHVGRPAILADGDLDVRRMTFR